MSRNKRKPSFDARQGELLFEIPAPAHRDGLLEGLDRRVSSAVANILNDAKAHGHSRFQVASGMSELLDDDVSKGTLDAYASESKDAHNISFARFLALVSETGAYGVLNGLLSEIGARVVVGEEIVTLELGHVQAQIRDLKAREAELARIVQPIKRGKS